jgi:hypothetical protein
MSQPDPANVNPQSSSHSQPIHTRRPPGTPRASPNGRARLYRLLDVSLDAPSSATAAAALDELLGRLHQVRTALLDEQLVQRTDVPMLD